LHKAVAESGDEWPRDGIQARQEQWHRQQQDEEQDEVEEERKDDGDILECLPRSCLPHESFIHAFPPVSRPLS
jgi:hypothetical protein